MPIHTEFKHLSNQITSLYGKNAFRLTLFGNKILVYGLFIQSTRTVMKFIVKIKKLREEQSLTQRQVAAELGIDVAMYNRFEKGERYMKRELVKNLAHIYGISEDELLTLWLAGKVYALLSEEDFAEDVI